MAKIYFNVKDKSYSFKEEYMAQNEDIPVFDNLAGKIALSSQDIVYFDGLDLYNENKDKIKKCLQIGYKPIMKVYEEIIASSYSLCPDCGEDIDIESESDIYIIDAQLDLRNLAKLGKNISIKDFSPNLIIGKIFTCPKCGASNTYYYDPFVSEEEMNSIIDKLKKHMRNGGSAYISYKYILDDDRKTFIPIKFNYMDFINYYDSEKDMLDEFYVDSSDYKKEDLKRDILRKIIMTISNEDIKMKLGEVKYIYDNIVFENFKRLKNTNTDFNLIQKYQEINNSRNKKAIEKLIVFGSDKA